MRPEFGIYWIPASRGTTNPGEGIAMTIELKLLALAIVLGLVQIVLAASATVLQTGLPWAAGPRDEAMPSTTAVCGRLNRAFSNFMETFPLFAAAVLIAHAVGQHDGMTVWGAQLYFWGRVVYVPLYAFGVFLARTLAWTVATAGIVLILLSLA
jgi:uncharacterized MAPEG superfamily protein